MVLQKLCLITSEIIQEFPSFDIDTFVLILRQIFLLMNPTVTNAILMAILGF